MKLFEAMPQTFQAKRFNCFVTDSEELIRDAQRLRHRVLAGELGANLKTTGEQPDYDEFDAYCEHLIVFDYFELKVVGCARLLNQVQANRIGCFYAQTEFDLGAVLTLPARFLEVGRACIDPDYPCEPVLSELWSGLARYAVEGRYSFLFGCAGIPPGPNGFGIDAAFRNVIAKNLAPPDLRVYPLIPVPPELRCRREECGIPPLLKSYLRLGAWVCGDPCWDGDFNVMDLFMLLPLERIKDSYGIHYPNKGAYDACRASAVV